MNDILENIKNLRESRNLSQEQIAEKMNITQSSYARFERGITKTDLKLLELFSNVIGISIIDLITFPEKWINVTNLDLPKQEEIRTTIQIELRNDKKDQILKLLFGEHNYSTILKQLT